MAAVAPAPVLVEPGGGADSLGVGVTLVAAGRSGADVGVDDVHAVTRTAAISAVDPRDVARTTARYQRTLRGTDDYAGGSMSVTRIPELRIELGPAAASIERAGRRVAELLSRQEDPDRGVDGLEWTIAETAAHLAGRTGRFARYLDGSASPTGRVGDIAAENGDDIRGRAGRDLPELVEELRSNVAAFVATTRGKLASDPMPWYSGVTIDVATAAGLLLGELLVHGFDLARTRGAPWPISAADGRTVLRAAIAVAPLYVDPDTTRGVSTTFRLAVRGGPTVRIRFDDGIATIDDAAGHADCTIRADPVSLVLISYGRVSKWREMAAGRLFATGRRPWAALAFDRYFVPP